MSARPVRLCCVVILCFFLGAGFSSILAAQPAAKPPAAASENCLNCHGPFDTLASQTGDYVMPSGEKTTPHRYVPHDSKKVPSCTSCHVRHDLPFKKNDKAAKANVDFCYANCHHTSNFKACKECHTDCCNP